MNPTLCNNFLMRESCFEYPINPYLLDGVIISRAADKEVLITARVGKMTGGEISNLLGRPETLFCTNRQWRNNIVDVRKPIVEGEKVVVRAFMPYSPHGEAIVEVDNMASLVTYDELSNLIWFREMPDLNQPSYGPRYTILPAQ